MAIIVRNVAMDEVAAANAVANNLQAQSSSATAAFFHADSTSNALTPDAGFKIPAPPAGPFITQSNAVDLLSGQQLALAIAGALIGSGQTADPPAHFYDAPANSPVLCGAHVVEDSVNTALLGARNTFVTAGGAVSASQTASDTFANAIQTYYNAHLTQSGVHYHNDTVNADGTTAATTLNTFITLVNALKLAVNKHIANANAKYPQIRVIAP